MQSESTQTLPTIFNVIFGQQVKNNTQVLLADATRIPIKLYACDPQDYDSEVCKRMMVTLSMEQIENEVKNQTVILSNKVLLCETQNVIVMSHEFIKVPSNINNPGEFLNYLLISDQLCLNIERLLRRN